MSRAETFDEANPEIVARFACLDCGKDTLELGEYYMVHNEVWLSVVKSTRAGMLCIGCLEDRLGRQLTPKDFTEFPINAMPERSQRMQDRVGTLPINLYAVFASYRTPAGRIAYWTGPSTATSPEAAILKVFDQLQRHPGRRKIDRDLKAVADLLQRNTK